MLGLPFGEDVGGGGQPYEVYLQVIEEVAARWASVALGISVHTLACFPIDRFGTVQLNVSHEELPAIPLRLCRAAELQLGTGATHNAMFVRTFADVEPGSTHTVAPFISLTLATPSFLLTMKPWPS